MIGSVAITTDGNAITETTEGGIKMFAGPR
jgi:hypothetical protein